MPLIEKEVLSPGTYWYEDQKTGVPRKFTATPEYIKHLRDQGNEMLALGLTVPVPCEHDFNAHPMTPREKLLNNAGWVKEYRVRDVDENNKNVLFSVVDIEDEEVAKKLPSTIKWTSPWLTSFTDGNGRSWNNVIAHLALTTRPRITKQAPFSSIAAAMSFAQNTQDDVFDIAKPHREETQGFTVSKAGRLRFAADGKALEPEFPRAFSLYAGGIEMGFGDKNKISAGGAKSDGDDSTPPSDDNKEGKSGKDGKKPPEGKSGDGKPPMKEGGDGADSFADQVGDIGMEELLGDLLGALGINVEHDGNEDTFKRALYNATMTKIHELTAQGQQNNQMNKSNMQQNPAGRGMNPPRNPIVQEQQPMYMSLEEINKIEDPVMRDIALSNYTTNKKNTDENEVLRKELDSLRQAKLKEDGTKRQLRVERITKMSPSTKADLEAMLAMPSMALSMGEAGVVIDPMAPTLAVLENGLKDIPKLLTTPSAALSAQPHPTDDAIALSIEEEDKLAENMARRGGALVDNKA